MDSPYGLVSRAKSDFPGILLLWADLEAVRPRPVLLVFTDWGPAGPPDRSEPYRHSQKLLETHNKQNEGLLRHLAEMERGWGGKDKRRTLEAYMQDSSVWN